MYSDPFVSGTHSDLIEGLTEIPFLFAEYKRNGDMKVINTDRRPSTDDIGKWLSAVFYSVGIV